jgi:hypothetical protein
MEGCTGKDLLHGLDSLPLSDQCLPMAPRKSSKDTLLLKPWFGDTLFFLGALSFFFLCMLLPLVGPAGSRTVHYWPQNFLTFLAVLLLAIAFSSVGWYAKIRRRREDQSPYPWWSAGITLFYLLWLAVFLAGGLKI